MAIFGLNFEWNKLNVISMNCRCKAWNLLMSVIFAGYLVIRVDADGRSVDPKSRLIAIVLTNPNKPRLIIEDSEVAGWNAITNKFASNTVRL